MRLERHDTQLARLEWLPSSMHDLRQPARLVVGQACINQPPEQLRSRRVRDTARALAELVGCPPRGVTAQSVVAMRVRTHGPR
jgi:hypothetical protein